MDRTRSKSLLNPNGYGKTFKTRILGHIISRFDLKLMSKEHPSRRFHSLGKTSTRAKSSPSCICHRQGPHRCWESCLHNILPNDPFPQQTFSFSTTCKRHHLNQSNPYHASCIFISSIMHTISGIRPISQ